MIGLCLPGGGAKGAFSAGVLYGLYQRGIRFNVISGTSIGAINAYFVYKNNYDELKKIWTTIDNDEFRLSEYSKNVIDNSLIINKLRKIEGKDDRVKSFYINYINVENTDLKEIILDISSVSTDEMLNYIKYSSLLPSRTDEGITIEDILNNFDSRRLFEEFQEDVSCGIYDGYNLDGGILNNNLLSPFKINKVEKLFIIPLNKDYVIPEDLLESYNKGDIIVIEPDSDMKPNDTLRFEAGFCQQLFYEGYEKGINLNMNSILNFGKV